MFEFWFQIPSKTCAVPFPRGLHRLGLHQSPVYCAAAGTIFGTTDVYELGFSYLSISIFTIEHTENPFNIL